MLAAAWPNNIRTMTKKNLYRIKSDKNGRTRVRQINRLVFNKIDMDCANNYIYPSYYYDYVGLSTLFSYLGKEARGITVDCKHCDYSACSKILGISLKKFTFWAHQKKNDSIEQGTCLWYLPNKTAKLWVVWMALEIRPEKWSNYKTLFYKNQCKVIPFSFKNCRQ